MTEICAYGSGRSLPMVGKERNESPSSLNRRIRDPSDEGELVTKEESGVITFRGFNSRDSRTSTRRSDRLAFLRVREPPRHGERVRGDERARRRSHRERDKGLREQIRGKEEA